ncbi:HNH endonuclease [Streptomyces phage phiScoe54]|nr:HNH endonuclease [Streptomyces phage phiScoe54]
MRCSVTSNKIGPCTRDAFADGLCAAHRSRLAQWGHVGADQPIRSYVATATTHATPKRGKGRTNEEKFYSRVRKTETCWIWTGGVITNTGYGQLRLDGYQQTANRWAWRLAFGEIPQGVKIAQTCGDKLCVRLSHLEAQHADGTPYFKDFTPAELAEVAA